MYYSVLIGYPTEHSVSHVLYEELLKAAGTGIVYKHLKIDVKDEELESSLEALKKLKFSGISVTLPHKIAVIEYLDELDPIAKELGAVNTIKPDVITKGFNTDWYGIVQSVKQEASNIKLSAAVIFGTGGVARAAIYAVKQLKIKDVTVLYRDDVEDAKTADLFNKADTLGITLLPYTRVKESVRDAELIINATSAGMIGKDPVPFFLNELDDIELSDKIYFDAVFSPLNTPLLQYFSDHNAVTIDGLWMMVHQGVLALTIWLDREIKIAPHDLHKIHKLLEGEIKNV